MKIAEQSPTETITTTTKTTVTTRPTTTKNKTLSYLLCDKSGKYCLLDYSHFGFTVCQPIGVADPNTITDDKMTASTIYHTAYQPYYGRLNGIRQSGAWCPKTAYDRTDYLQVDMGAVHSVCAVATQAGKEGQLTGSYKLRVSLDGTRFNAYMENSIEKVS